MCIGNEEAIISGISSDTPIVTMNALLSGARHRINNNQFVQCARHIRDTSTDVIMNVQLNKVATAVLHVIGADKYSGVDDIINRYINEINKR